MAMDVNLLLACYGPLQVGHKSIHRFIDYCCVGLQRLAVEHWLHSSPQAAPLCAFVHKMLQIVNKYNTSAEFRPHNSKAPHMHVRWQLTCTATCFNASSVRMQGKSDGCNVLQHAYYEVCLALMSKRDFRITESTS